MMRRALLAFLLLAPWAAHAVPFVPGQVLTAGELNAAFAAVLPVAGGTLTGALTLPGLTDSGTASVAGLLTANGGMTTSQTGAGGTLASLLLMTRTEPSTPAGNNDVASLVDNLNFADGIVFGHAGLRITTNVNGNGVTGPSGNAYPIIVQLNENSLRSLSSPPTASQDTVLQSNVFKTVPVGGIPAGRVMRDAWNWWSQYFGANLPSSQTGVDAISEHDFVANGLDDAGLRPLDQTIIHLNTPLASGGFPLSFSTGRYMSTDGGDEWAHNWDTIGGNFSHAGIDLFFIGSTKAIITSTTPVSPTHSVTVDNIMPLESGGSAGGGIDFPIASTAVQTRTTTAVVTAAAVVPLTNTNYLAVGEFVYDTNSWGGIPSGTRVSSISGNSVTLSSNVTVGAGDSLIFSRATKNVTINGNPYIVAGVALGGAGVHSGTVYFLDALTVADATNAGAIVPGTHSIWLCDGSDAAPWCDIAFNRSGSANIRGDGAGGLQIAGAGLNVLGTIEVGGAPLAPSALIDTTNAANISSNVFSPDRLPPSGVLAGTYGDASHINRLDVDSTGRITGITSIPVAGGGGTVSGPLAATAGDIATFADTSGALLSDGGPLAAIARSGSASDLVGTVPAALLPAPAASTLGGVESLAAVTHKWINTISTAGAPAATQPACGDLSDFGTACQAATGTSGHTLGFLDGSNTWSAAQAFGAGSFTSLLTLGSAAGVLPSAQTGSVLQAVGDISGGTTRIELDAYAGQGFFTSVGIGGTSSVPTAVTSGTQIGGFNAYAYNGTSNVGPIATFRTFAAENQSSGHQGAYAEIATTPISSTTLTSRMRFENDGGVTLPSTVTGGDKGVGTLNATGLYVAGSPGVSASGSLTSGHCLQLSGSAGVVVDSGAACAGSAGVLNDYFTGLSLTNDASTATKADILAGMAADSTNALMLTTTGCIVDLAAAGANGLDTGSVASNTWYGFFIIHGASGDSCVASAATTGSITGNGTSTGASTTAASTTITLSSSQTLAKGAVIYIEAAGVAGPTSDNGGFTTTIAVTNTGTSFTVADKVPTTKSFQTVTWSQFANGDGPTMPSGYTTFRIVGELSTDPADTNLIKFVQTGDEVRTALTTYDVNAVTPANSPGTVYTFAVPRAMRVYPMTRWESSTANALTLQSPERPPQTPTNGAAIPGADTSSAGPVGSTNDGFVTNGVAQGRLVATVASGTTNGWTIGWRYLNRRQIK